MKTKNAFAFRELYADIKPNNKKTPVQSLDDFEIFGEYFTRKSDNVDRPLDDNLAALFWKIDRCLFCIKASERQFQRINRHLRRLKRHNFRNFDRVDFLFNAYLSLMTACINYYEFEKMNHEVLLADLRDAQTKQFRERLKAARKRKKLSQKEVADFLGVVQKSYSQYETGRSQPPLPTLYLLSKKFNVSIDWLAGLK